MSLESQFESLSPGEPLIHVNIIDNANQEFLVYQKKSVAPFEIVLVARKVVKLINGEWQMISLQFFPV